MRLFLKVLIMLLLLCAVNAGAQNASYYGTAEAGLNKAKAAISDSLDYTGYYDIQRYGAKGDGTTNDTAAFTAAIAAMPAGATLWLGHGKDYYINTAGGVSFTKKIRIVGYGDTIRIGATVGNAPGITIGLAANESVIEGVTVLGTANHTDGGDNDYSDAGDAQNLNLRDGIKVLANDVIVRDAVIVNCVWGIRYDGADGGAIENCYLVNSLHDAVSNPTAEGNYNAGIFINDSDGIEITGNRIVGFGQNILVAETCLYAKVMNNYGIKAANNGIYVSSGDDCFISGNTIAGVQADGIKVRGSRNTISQNRVWGNLATYVPGDSSGIGIVITGSSADIGTGHGGEKNVVDGNIISGDWVEGIRVAVAYDMYLKDGIVSNNTIHFDAAPKAAAYGIYVVDTSVADTLSDGLVIRGNHIRGQKTQAILVGGRAGYFHHRMEIVGNNIVGGSADQVRVTYTKNSTIRGNLIQNAAATMTALYLSNSSYNLVENNDLRDTQDTPTQLYGIEEVNACNYNVYLNNEIRFPASARCVFVGANTVKRFRVERFIVPLPTRADSTAQDSLWVQPYFEYDDRATVRALFTRFLSESNAATDSVQMGVDFHLHTTQADSFMVDVRASAAGASEAVVQILLIGRESGTLYLNEIITPTTTDWEHWAWPPDAAIIPEDVLFVIIPRVQAGEYIDVTDLTVK